MTGTPVAPAVTPHDDADPSPRVDVVLPDVPADAATVTLYRYADGQRVPVRGALNMPAASPVATDYEAPIGVPVQYLAEAQDAAGTPSLLGPLSAPVTLNSPGLWLSDPLAPGTVVMVTLGRSELAALADSFAELTFASTSTRVALLGSDLPLGMGGIRQAASGVPVELLTDSREQAAALEALLRRAYPLLIRTPDVLSFLPGAIYADVSDVTMRPVRRTSTGLDYSRARWSMTVTRVQPPSAAAVVSVRTWDDLPDEAPTWNELATLYPTWNDVARG